MADNDLMDEHDDMQDDASSSMKPKRGVGGLIPMLIKWVAVVLGAVIFIVTVVIITMNVRDKKGKSHSEYPISEEYRDTRDELDFYGANGGAISVLKIQTSERIPSTVMVGINLGYTKNDKSTPQELSARKVEIIDYLLSYFQNKTTAELKQREKIRIELRNEINDNILTKTKIKDVRFTQYDIVEQ